MYSSDKGVDVFKEHTIDELLNIGSSAKKDDVLLWTKDFLSTVNITETQKA